MRQFFLFLLLFNIFDIQAQRITVRNFTSDDYNSGSQNWNIEVLESGEMLFGNNRGLLIFDSRNWKCYPVSNYSTVRSIYVDRQWNKIYVGASDEIGYFEIDNNNGLIYHSLVEYLEEACRTFGEVWNIIPYGEEILFISKTKIIFYNLEAQQMRVVEPSKRIESSALIDGEIIIGSDDGAYVLKQGKLTPLVGTQIIKGEVIKSIMEYGKEIIFFTTVGIYKYDGKRTERFAEDLHDYLKLNGLFSAEIKGNTMVIGTVRGGIIIKNLNDGTTEYITTDDGLQDNTVISVKIDDLNNVWCGLEEGLSYVITDMPWRKLQKQNIGTGYASITFNDKIYLGTNQGLYSMSFSLNSKEFEHIQGVDEQVWSLTTIDNQLYCCTDKGVYIITSNHSEKIENTAGTWQLIKLNSTHMLGLNYSGLFTINNDGSIHQIENFDQVSNHVLRDKDGSLWIPHWQKGIYHLWLSADDTKVVKMVLYNKDNQLLSDQNNDVCEIDGEIYISAVDGFYRYNKDNEELEKEPWLDNLFNTYGFPLHIRQMENGVIWAEKPDYLALVKKGREGKYEIDSLTFRHLRNSLQMDLGQYSNIDKYTTLFNSKGGFTIVYNDKKFLPTEGDVLIRISTINGEKTICQDKDKEEIIIEKEDNSLRFEFVLPEYRKEDAVSYECFLKGYDKILNTVGNVNYKEYTHIPAGTYTFHVKTVNHLSSQTNEKKIKIKILPSWWETSIAKIIYLVIFLVLLYQIRRIIRRRSELELERERKEKTRKLAEQEAIFNLEKEKQEKELLFLRNEQLNIELKHKSGELADSTINIIRKNDMLMAIDNHMIELEKEKSREMAQRKIKDIRREIKLHMKEDDNWDKFEENFNLVYDDFMKKLLLRFPGLKLNERKLCAYLRMGLSSKEIASLMNTTERSIETARYRLRQKMQLGGSEGGTTSTIRLKEYLQSIE